MFGKILTLLVSAAPGIVALIKKLSRKTPHDPKVIGQTASDEIEVLEEWKSQSDKDWGVVRGED